MTFPWTVILLTVAVAVSEGSNEQVQQAGEATAVGMQISWSKDRIPLDPLEGNERYSIVSNNNNNNNSSSNKNKPSSSALSSSLRIRSVDRRDSSLFTCSARNPYGSAELNLQLIVQGKRQNRTIERESTHSLFLNYQQQQLNPLNLPASSCSFSPNLITSAFAFLIDRSFFSPSSLLHFPFSRQSGSCGECSGREH